MLIEAGKVPTTTWNLQPFRGMLERQENRESCVARGLPRMKRLEPNTGRISIVGYGPGLKTTWQEIPRPIVTVSGAHDFLIKRGIIPDYHVECDPQVHKAKALTRPHKDCTYLIASACSPVMFDQLKDANVQYWHAGEGEDVIEWVKENDPEAVKIGGGSNAGLRAIAVAGFLGYSRFDLYGMDCSFTGRQHAGPHYGKIMRTMTAKITTGPEAGRVFMSSPAMIESANYLVWMVANLDIDIEVHGDSLARSMVMDAKRQIEEKLRKAA